MQNQPMTLPYKMRVACPGKIQSSYFQGCCRNSLGFSSSYLNVNVLHINLEVDSYNS